MSYMQGPLNGANNGMWWQCYVYMGSATFADWLLVTKDISDTMSKLFEIHRPSAAAIVTNTTAAKGLYFDMSVEPAQDDGKEITGWDVSVSCDDPRAFFEDRRMTLTGVGDFIRDCARTLVVEKFPVLAFAVAEVKPQLAIAAPVAEVPGGVANTLLCEADFE